LKNAKWKRHSNANSGGKRKKRKTGKSDDLIESRNDDDATTDSITELEQRKVFDKKWLFAESTHQHLCFEEPQDNCEGSPGDSVFKTVGGEPTNQLRDQNVLAGVHVKACSALEMCMFNKSDLPHHSELTLDEVKKLRDVCFEEDIEDHCCPAKGQSCSSNFLKVAHQGSDDWKHVMEGADGLELQFDAPEVVRELPKLCKEGDKAVTSEDERKSIHFDGGFGCQSDNCQQSPEETPTTASFPVLINEPKEGDPAACGRLHHHVGDALDRLQDHVDLRGKENGKLPMNDPFRTEHAGKVLRSACGAKRA